MDCKTLNQYPLRDILAALGSYPERENPHELWFLSPLREEKTPSLKVDKTKNVWFDHGIGSGGRAIDLLMQRYGCDVSEALRHAQTLFNGSFSFHPPPSAPPAEEKPELLDVLPITHEGLLDYLRSRCISLDVASYYLFEVHYLVKGKRFFGLGFPNDSDGFEIRSKCFKGCLGKKDVSFFKDHYGPKPYLAVFEGFIDFLSALTYYRKRFAECDVLVLNSLSMKDRVRDYLQPGFSLALYLDNDKAGREATNFFNSGYFPHIKDCSSVYRGFKDFNEFLTKKGEYAKTEA